MDNRILDRIKEWLTDESENPVDKKDDHFYISIGRKEASRDLLDFIYEMETKGVDYEESEFYQQSKESEGKNDNNNS